MRTHPCVRLFCVVDTLTITSMLPGADVSIDEMPMRSRPGRSRPHLKYVTTLPISSSQRSEGRRGVQAFRALYSSVVSTTLYRSTGARHRMHVRPKVLRTSAPEGTLRSG
jgi:hypothetical protein